MKLYEGCWDPEMKLYEGAVSELAFTSQNKTLSKERKIKPAHKLYVLLLQPQQQIAPK